MAKKSKTQSETIKNTRKPEEIAEKRISAWKRGLKKKVDWSFHLLENTLRGENKLVGEKKLVIDLKGLGLQAVPESIRDIFDAEILDLADNKINELPPWIGELSGLQIISLARNQLRTLPDSIADLPNLLHLILQENLLDTLPKTLQTSNIIGLYLHGNPNLGIPENVLDYISDREKIFRYYFESRDENSQPLLELKLLLVGRGKAGKTTLVKQLAGEEPDEHEPETHSIEIRDLTFECPRGNVRTRAWDFGGQEILHSTHQFFLSDHSLYLIVIEPRTGLAQRDAEYWLKLIETRGGSSPVIVVMNWSQHRSWRVDEVKLRRKFPFIVDFVLTDALHGDGIEALQRIIIQTVERMPEVWLPFPLRWRTIKDNVAGMRSNFLTYEEYTTLCNDHGETDPDAQANLASIMHALGLALYFGKDQELHDTRVLNPGWVTGSVYAVICAPCVAENDGQLAVHDMPRVLNEAEIQNVIKTADYPVATHGFILELMRAFELGFASEEEKGEPGESVKPVRYLVPELLPEFEPEMPEPWEKAPIHLRYRYDVLPPGLLPRIIVRTHALSDGAPHWRHGVVLRHGDASALIREELDQPILNIFVLGGNDDTRRVLVTILRHELVTLHREMKIKSFEDLKLTGEAELWISVKALREIEDPVEPTKRVPIQPEGTTDVNVPLELNKLHPAEARAIDRDPTTAPTPVRLFVSYAHDDERQLKRLDAILGVLEQQHGLVSWVDTRLIAGEEWDMEIRRRIKEMDIFLFIASQMSLVRSYIKDPELKLAKERYDNGDVEILVVKLEPCAIDDDPFLGKLQRLAPKRSIAESKLKAKAWEDVRKDLLKVIKRVRMKKKKCILNN